MKIHIGKRIKQLIEERGLIKAEIGRKLHWHPNTLFKLIEREDANTENLMELSRQLDYNIFYDLLFDERLRNIKNPVDLSEYHKGDSIAIALEPEAAYGKLKTKTDACEEENRRLKDLVIELQGELLRLKDKR